jgi:hypothetical protein
MILSENRFPLFGIMRSAIGYAPTSDSGLHTQRITAAGLEKHQQRSHVRKNYGENLGRWPGAAPINFADA